MRLPDVVDGRADECDGLKLVVRLKDLVLGHCVAEIAVWPTPTIILSSVKYHVQELKRKVRKFFHYVPMITLFSLKTKI